MRPVQIFYIQGGIDWDKLQSRRFKISAGEDEPVNGGVVNSRVVNGGNGDLFLDPVMKFWWSRIVINIRWRVGEYYYVVYIVGRVGDVWLENGGIR